MKKETDIIYYNNYIFTVAILAQVAAKATMPKLYKKQLCKYKKCKYRHNAYMCSFAHYPEELRQIPKFMQIISSKNSSLLCSIHRNRYRDVVDILHLACTECDTYCDGPKSKTIINYIEQDTITFNNAGVLQLFKKFNVVNNIGNIILSFMGMPDKAHLGSVDTCNWCKKLFSYKYDEIHKRKWKRSLMERNNPFYDIDYRKSCNIGPLCICCALYKIPIRCDICNKYTNANNIDFKYNVKKDQCIFELLSCNNTFDISDSMKEIMYKHDHNICTPCILSYYNKLLRLKECVCEQYDNRFRSYTYYFATDNDQLINDCGATFRDIIERRYGTRWAKNYL